MESGAIRPPAKIAVIGLGNMGQPMAACLRKAGFEVRGYDASERSRASFTQAGGTSASSAAEMVAEAEAVVTLLPNGKVVRSVAEEVRGAMKPGAVFIDMSSSDPIGTRKLGEEMITAGFGFVDAPVSGGVKRAIAGTLSIMAGGHAATIDKV